MAPRILGWTRTLSSDWYEIQWSGGTTQEEILGWLRTSNLVGPQFWGLVLLFSQVAFLLFLIALFRQGDEVQDTKDRRSYWLREAAALATIVGGVALLGRIGQQIYTLVELRRHGDDVAWLGSPSPGTIIVGMAVNILPELCWMLAAYIVYKSVPVQPAVEGV